MKHSMPNRDMAGYMTIIAAIIGGFLSLFHLYTAYAGLLTAVFQRATHITAIMIMVFLSMSFGFRSKEDETAIERIINISLAFASLAAGMYLIVSFEGLLDRLGTPNTMDLFFGGIFIVLLLEATRRAIGWQLPLIAIIFIVYAYVGPYLFSWISHKGFSTKRIISHLYLTTEGVFGLPLGVSASYIILFVIFGQVLDKSGGGKFFLDFAYGIAGRSRGGPAKAAVVASSLFGTMSGSAVANVVTTGTFTIPLMKKTGYKPYFAGAVEAVASSGGLIMPPIMGAGAFVMSEITGIPYAQIIIAALIPAVLYYLSIFTQVDLEAGKEGLKPLSKEELPSLSKAFKERGHMLLPLAALIFFLMIRKTSPMPAGLWAVVITLAIGSVKKITRMSVMDFFDAMAGAGKAMVPVATACASAGLVIGIISLTGIGLKFSNTIMEIAGGNVVIALILVMFATIILGMGVPPTASYIVMSTLGAPSLVEMGIPMLAAHLFIFYFAAFANITPPVALAAYAASGIAKDDPMKTGFQAFKLGLVGFIIPFMFVYSQNLLILGIEPFKILISFATAVIGVICLALAIEGWFRRVIPWYQRIIASIAAILLISPEFITDIVGLALVVEVIIFTYYRKKAETVQGIVGH